uniref:Uncharacterized protein n=1 Tax=Lepeophtheirus salmonis TaxID=72036 RepID=A0A0K2TIA6_LEPSM
MSRGRTAMFVIQTPRPSRPLSVSTGEPDRELYLQRMTDLLLPPGSYHCLERATLMIKRAQTHICLWHYFC